MSWFHTVDGNIQIFWLLEQLYLVLSLNAGRRAASKLLIRPVTLREHLRGLTTRCVKTKKLMRNKLPRTITVNVYFVKILTLFELRHDAENNGCIGWKINAITCCVDGRSLRHDAVTSIRHQVKSSRPSRMTSSWRNAPPLRRATAMHIGQHTTCTRIYAWLTNRTADTNATRYFSRTLRHYRLV